MDEQHGGGGNQDQQRQRQVSAGAGLQESRLNTDFIEWLGKWGPRALWVVLIIVGGYAALQAWGRYQLRETDAAFDELNTAIQQQDLQMLQSVADKHEGRAAVAALARLELARQFNAAGVTGIDPMFVPDPENPDAQPERLTEEQMTQYFERAVEEADRVVDLAEGRAALSQQALWTKASAELSLGRYDEARGTLQAFLEGAEEAGLSAVQGPPAEARLARLDEFADRYALLSEEELPEFAREPEVAGPAGGQGMGLPPGVTFTPNDPDASPIGGSLEGPFEGPMQGPGGEGGLDFGLPSLDELNEEGGSPESGEPGESGGGEGGDAEGGAESGGSGEGDAGGGSAEETPGS